MRKLNKKERFQESVLSKFHVYNSIFATLPYESISETGNLLPIFSEFWKIIYEEYLLTKKMLLKISNFKELMENEPANKLSIETREAVVMPLITIQQYALQIVNEIDSKKMDNLKKPIFEKMITRSLYGNINASRNSA